MDKKRFITIIGILGLAIIIIVIVVVLRQRNIPNTNSNTSTNIQNYLSNIVIGSTTITDVKKALGAPGNDVTDGDYEKLTYLNNSTLNSIYFKNNVAYIVLYADLDDSGVYKNYVEQNNLNPLLAMSDQSYDPSIFTWYIFPSEGIAFLTNQDRSDTIYTMHYLKMDTLSFQNEIAPVVHLINSGQPYLESFK